MGAGGLQMRGCEGRAVRNRKGSNGDGSYDDLRSLSLACVEVVLPFKSIRTDADAGRRGSVGGEAQLGGGACMTGGDVRSSMAVK